MNIDNAQLLQLYYVPESNYEFKATLGVKVNQKYISLYSNTIHFKIHKPIGPEIEEYDSLLSFYDTYLKNPKVDLQIKAKKYFLMFPNSVYNLRIQNFVSSPFSNPDASLSFYSNLIKSDPENYYNAEYLSKVGFYLKDKKEEYVKYLDGLVEDFRGTLLQRLALEDLNEAKFR